jgi:hypothetical protein
MPPNVDSNTENPAYGVIQGYGLRVPGLLISPYAKAGTIDHGLLSFDSYATFIEDNFMNGARLDPAALGNPDNRPDIRDSLTSVPVFGGGTEPIARLMNEFDFTQTPRPPLILSTHIPTGITVACGGPSLPYDSNQLCTQASVTISWNSVSGKNVREPFTYHVTRDGNELPQCVVTATSCVDTPPTGIHLYRAYSVDKHKVVSPTSAAAEADVP